MIAVVMFVGYYHVSSTAKIPISAKIMVNDCSENIMCWQNENGDYYIFLPSYAELSQVSLSKETSSEIFLDESPIVDGMTCETLKLDYPYVLTYMYYGREVVKTLTIVRSGNVPTMYIDTFSGSMEYIHEKKGNEESAVMRVYDASGNLCNGADVETINGRGNSSWQRYEKKTYSLHFAFEIDLLEMGLAKEWILQANASDDSNIRNKLIYDFASEFGLNYSPNSKWVDLYLNGNYVGLYLLCERNEVYDTRVNISGSNASLISLEMESRLEDRNLVYTQTDSEQTFRIHYPYSVDADTLVAVKQSWQSVENAILAEDGIDSVTGKSWLELIDLESWAKKYLIEEVFGNIDAGYLSQYFYIDETGKAFAGPVWDYDYAIGNDVLWQLTSSNIQLANKRVVNIGVYREWFYNLSQKEEFQACVLSIYQSEFLPLLKNNFSGNIDEYVSYISIAAEINSIRWFGSQSWLDNVEDVNLYINERIDFFNKLWFEDVDFYTVSLHSRESENNSYQMIVHGETVSNLPVLENRENEKFVGWYYVDTNQPFDSSMPIYEDVNLYAKWEEISTNKIKTIVKIMPIFVIFVMFILLLIVDVKRNVRRRN